jgi:hypothetical protein
MEKLGFSDLMTRIEASHEGHIDELGEIIDLALNKTIKRVISSQKKGVLTINLTFNTVGENRMAVDANVTTKLPEPKADSSFLYHDLKGNLTENDPMQPQLFENVKPLKRVNQGEQQ